MSGFNASDTSSSDGERTPPVLAMEDPLFEALPDRSLEPSGSTPLSSLEVEVLLSNGPITPEDEHDPLYDPLAAYVIEEGDNVLGEEPASPLLATEIATERAPVAVTSSTQIVESATPLTQSNDASLEMVEADTRVEQEIFQEITQEKLLDSDITVPLQEAAATELQPTSDADVTIATGGVTGNVVTEADFAAAPAQEYEDERGRYRLLLVNGVAKVEFTPHQKTEPATVAPPAETPSSSSAPVVDNTPPPSHADAQQHAEQEISFREIMERERREAALQLGLIKPTKAPPVMHYQSKATTGMLSPSLQVQTQTPPLSPIAEAPPLAPPPPAPLEIPIEEPRHTAESQVTELSVAESPSLEEINEAPAPEYVEPVHQELAQALTIDTIHDLIQREVHDVVARELSQRAPLLQQRPKKQGKLAAVSRDLKVLRALDILVAAELDPVTHEMVMEVEKRILSSLNRSIRGKRRMLRSR
jgi:hypothetical protein